MRHLLLTFAILTEVAGTSFLKASHGLSRLIPSVLMAVFYVASLVLLSLALKKIEVSVAYAVWSGLGTALIALVGFFVFKETLGVAKIFSLVLIIAGVIGLNLADRISV